MPRWELCPSMLMTAAFNKRRTHSSFLGLPSTRRVSNVIHLVQKIAVPMTPALRAARFIVESPTGKQKDFAHVALIHAQQEPLSPGRCVIRES